MDLRKLVIIGRCSRLQYKNEGYSVFVSILSRSSMSITTKSAVAGISKYFDLSFFGKFLVLLLGLYYFNIFYLGITSPNGRVYSAYLEEHLNYISWISASILHVSDLIVWFFGIDAHVENFQDLKSSSGAWVSVWLPCLGLGIISFWIAFVISHRGSWKRKLLWSIGGVMLIWFINCWRIAFLLLALDRQWYLDTYVDHHTLFNIIAYSAIGMLVYMYSKSNTKAVGKSITG